jgi:hypothetical protein
MRTSDVKGREDDLCVCVDGLCQADHASMTSQPGIFPNRHHLDQATTGDMSVTKSIQILNLCQRHGISWQIYLDTQYTARYATCD